MMTKLAMLATSEVANAVSLDSFDIEGFIDTCVNGIMKLTQLFTIFPINIMLVGGPVLGIVIGIFVKVKRAATRK